MSPLLPNIASDLKAQYLPAACLVVFGWFLVAMSPVSVRAQGKPDEADAMFRHLDSNKDGKLTMGDAGANNRRMLEQIFNMAGKLESGSISRAEFQQVFEKHRGGRGGDNPSRNSETAPSTRILDGGLPSILRLLDTDGDQRLTRAELNRLGQMFDRLDANKDGALDAVELRAAERGDLENKPPNAESRPTNSKGGTSSPLPAAESRSRDTTERSADNAPVGDGSRLAGVWRGWVVDGRGETPNAGQMEIELTIEGNRITGRELGTRRAPGGLGGGTFVMTGGGATGNLDADGTSGPQDGRHFLGVYELQGDTLRWCVSNRGRQRPQAMASERGNYLMILHKQSSKK